VFIGAGRVTAQDAASGISNAPEFRAVVLKHEIENVGLRKVGLRRAVADPSRWEILVSVRNFGRNPASAPLALQFAGSPAGSRRLALKPGEERDVRFEYHTRAAGLLEARLLSSDGFPGDDRAIVELPGLTSLKVVVYSDRPDLLQPILTSNPLVEADFRNPAEYEPNPGAAVVILDRMRPSKPPEIPSIWIRPPREASPLAVRESATSAKLNRWNSDHALGAGLRTRDLILDSTEVYRTRPGDVVVAEVEQGPIIVARPDGQKIVVLGFHPMDSSMKFDLATPLLFANIVRWISPDAFRHWEVNAGSAGLVHVPLAPGMDPNGMRVTSEGNRPIPFTLSESGLQFFAGTPGTVRVSGAGSDLIYSTTLPEVPAAELELPPGTREGLPSRMTGAVFSQDIWHWLALLGGLGLLVEWLLYGRARRRLAPIARPKRTEPIRRAS
jgi:hypothetical protein